MTTKQAYYQATESLFETIRNTQDENITRAATLMADAVANDGCIHLFDTGHIIDMEILNRAGGFELMRRFKYDLAITGNARVRQERDKEKSMEGLALYALRKGDVMPGDVMVIGSVSGKTSNVVDLAVECKKMGVKTITISSHTYSSQLESEHSSKKRLFELGDVNIDNCAPWGDAMLDVEGLDSKFIPASGLAAAYIMWGINADLADALLVKNIKPGILRSVNHFPNRAYNIKLGEDYQKNNS